MAAIPLLLLGTGAAGCDAGGSDRTAGAGASAVESGYPLAVADCDGREVLLEKRPERIVIVGPPLYAEVVVDLGAADRVAGRTVSPESPPALDGIESVGKPLGWSLEKVVTLRPDLVLGAVGKEARRLRALGIPVLTTGRPGGRVSGLEDVIESIRTIDRALHGSDERSAPRIAAIRRRVEATAERVRGRPRPRAAFIYAPREYAPTAAGRETPEHELIELAGAENAFAAMDGYGSIGLEPLILSDPDAIVTSDDQVAQIAGEPRLAGMRAVREGRVIGIRSSRIASTRFASTLEALAEMLHPEAVAR